jgi:hypothetical protein
VNSAFPLPSVAQAHEQTGRCRGRSRIRAEIGSQCVDSPWRDGQRLAAINIRCLEGIDLEAITIQRFDGRSL